MNIVTSDSGIKSPSGQRQAVELINKALAKIDSRYVALFEKICGKISIERVIAGGSEDTVGFYRYPMDIAIKTSELYTDVLDRTLTEEIIHYLDTYLKFSKEKAAGMQAAVNRDAQHPLSLAMLAAVRGGTKGLASMDDIAKGPEFGEMMVEFSKELPFLGVYHDGQNMDQYEWLAELEHAEQTLSRVANPHQANLLSGRAQSNMFMTLVLRFLSNHGFDIVTEWRNMRTNKDILNALQEIGELVVEKDINGWLVGMADKVEVDLQKAERPPRGALEKITLSIAQNMALSQTYPLSVDGLRGVMASMFPESYDILRQFREEVGKELERLNGGIADGPCESAGNGTGPMQKHLQKRGGNNPFPPH